MVDLLDDAASDAVRIQRKNAERAEAQVAHRAVSDELLHIFLHQADERAVNDAHHRKHHEDVDDVLPRNGVGRQKRQ